MTQCSDSEAPIVDLDVCEQRKEVDRQLAIPVAFIFARDGSCARTRYTRRVHARPGPHERHTNAGGSVVAFSPSRGLTTARTAGSRSHVPRRVTVLPPPAAALWARSAVMWRIVAVARHCASALLRSMTQCSDSEPRSSTSTFASNVKKLTGSSPYPSRSYSPEMDHAHGHGTHDAYTRARVLTNATRTPADRWWRFRRHAV